MKLLFSSLFLLAFLYFDEQMTVSASREDPRDYNRHQLLGIWITDICPKTKSRKNGARERELKASAVGNCENALEHLPGLTDDERMPCFEPRNPGCRWAQIGGVLDMVCSYDCEPGRVVTLAEFCAAIINRDYHLEIAQGQVRRARAEAVAAAAAAAAEAAAAEAAAAAEKERKRQRQRQQGRQSSRFSPRRMSSSSSSRTSLSPSTSPPPRTSLSPPASTSAPASRSSSTWPPPRARSPATSTSNTRGSRHWRH